MHRATKTAGATDGPPADLADHLIGSETQGEGMAVAAIGAGNDVIGPRGARNAYRYRFLPAAQMCAAAHFAFV